MPVEILLSRLWHCSFMTDNLSYVGGFYHFELHIECLSGLVPAGWIVSTRIFICGMRSFVWLKAFFG